MEEMTELVTILKITFFSVRTGKYSNNDSIIKPYVLFPFIVNNWLSLKMSLLEWGRRWAFKLCFGLFFFFLEKQCFAINRTLDACSFALYQTLSTYPWFMVLCSSVFCINPLTVHHISAPQRTVVNILKSHHFLQGPKILKVSLIFLALCVLYMVFCMIHMMT